MTVADPNTFEGEGEKFKLKNYHSVIEVKTFLEISFFEVQLFKQ